MNNLERIQQIVRDLEAATIADYFSNCYDVDYIVSRDKHYKACRVLVDFDPHICVDTWRGKVALSWQGKYAEVAIPKNICKEIDAYFRMVYKYRFLR